MTFTKMCKFFAGKAALAAALPLLLLSAAVPAFAQAQADVKFAGVFYQDSSADKYCGWKGSALKGNAVSLQNNTDDNRSFVSKNITNANGSTYGDPWENSALIEYDQPYPAPDKENTYPNHCLGLCMEVYCSNKPLAMSTYSIAFPLQTIKFDIVKYYGGKNISSSNDTPPIRTLTMYPGTGATGSDNIKAYTCGSYHCYNAQKGTTCPSAVIYCDSEGAPKCTVNGVADQTMNWTDTCQDDGKTAGGVNCCTNKYGGTDGATNCVIFDNNGTKYGEAMPFCAGWDGSYEISGEFGKTNGQYGFRATVQSDVPGDNITVDKINIDSTIPYPGENQIPIQVDVTNVHTVRSTPTVVGNITSVSAQPYTVAYRLSKDSDVRIAIYDAETTGGSSYTGTATPGSLDVSKRRRLLVDWKPRLGEGMKGADSDKQLVEFDSWDGRDDSGRLLPAGNYVISIQAKSQDEWPGIDFSRAVTRQLSLDPLKLTDVVVMGLNKQSTAYATIKYVPTESSKVYFEVYTPGTQFEKTTTPTNGNAASPTIKAGTGYRVYSSVEERGSRATYTTKWDGTCMDDATCNGTTAIAALGGKTFIKGAPMPDGNYVYVLWAEIPYQENYTNAANVVYSGVKTVNYTIGTMPVERGLVDITIQPVSYSTVGSSPTVYGLDPFVFKFILSRDSTASAEVQNTAGLTVKHLTPAEGQPGVAQQINTLSWDGRDDAGRMVGPGTYVFAVKAKDGMFPDMVNTATAVFPVDLYHVVDVATTDVYGDSEAKATISYYLSKAMNVQVNIYNKDVVIPVDNTLKNTEDTTGPTTATTTAYVPSATVGTTYDTQRTFNNNITTVVVTQKTVTLATEAELAAQCAGITEADALATCRAQNKYKVVSVNTTTTKAMSVWPPKVCNTADHPGVFTAGHVDPSKIASTGTKCIYVNDTTFTNYPANSSAALDVRLQPVKTFDASSTRPGEGSRIVEEWDALYFYNPSSAQCKGATDLKSCAYEMVPDGQYPFYISARSNEPVSVYYNADTLEPFTKATDVKQESFIYATEKPSYRINVTRGPVFFLDGSTAVYPNQPQLFNVSSGPVFVPPYEINFAVSRAATVDVQIVALKPNVCTTTATDGSQKNNQVGDVCKHLATTTVMNTGNFDPNVTRKVYWDGTDDNGYYVKSAVYEVRFIAKNYPDANLYQETVKSISLNADLLKVFDLLEVDGYAQAVRGQNVPISYQISVPMKVAIQIFKPGTTVYDYQKGTLRNPTTGKEVKDINEVLVRSIVGIRPSTTLITEEWDGRDYAQQEVPDGTYPFRFVTATASADIDTITGEIIPGDDAALDAADWKVNYVADADQYRTLHKATIAIGDGRFVCSDWEKTVFFYPNPLRQPYGTLEITKMPVPGTMSIKLYTLAGTLIRDSGYTCVDANNYTTTIGQTLSFSPDNNISGDKVDETTFANVRNAALRCRWDKTNQHGKKVARGVYFGLVDFKAQNGREHCQKVVKILIP
ncbi:FlgD immunoglobulin-like domain containing protein [Candidatus Avelusimicrobium faecicola]|uniref:FlgD immunoglobulin-like domain containing protein n=1 Tax=Candidatus Avelusimicrobium faecicola TaxID=3416205 RepID=UPI003D12FB5E